MITGYLCDLHRGTATEVQARQGPRGVIVHICTDCWDDMSHETQWHYLKAVGPLLRTDLGRGTRRGHRERP